MHSLEARWRRPRQGWTQVLRLARTLPPGEILKRLITRPGRALRLLLSTAPRAVDAYEAWRERHQPTPQFSARVTAEIAGWSRRPRFSLLMPVYDPPADYLRAAIASVRAQLYPDWELCVADDASNAPHVREILEEARRADARIKVTRLAANRGISGASNAALALATGEFVAPVDHDDTLAPEALYEVARRLQVEPDLDFLYTDHDMRNVEGQRFGPFFKPDWSPDLILAMNYVTHFAVYRRDRVEAVGGYREGLEGSQDHDLVLRVTERTERIGHVRLPLYSWAQSPTSIARLPQAKPYAHAAGMRAIRDAVARRGIDGTVEEAYDALYRYRIRRRVQGEPLVSIVALPGAGGTLPEALARALSQRTRYGPYELVPAPAGLDRALAGNEAARGARGEILLFLSADAVPVVDGWLETLVGHAQRPEIGAVGARLQFPDESVRHAGYVVGVDPGAVHAFWGLPGDHPGYWDFARVERNCSAVSGECLMIRRDLFLEEGGFDTAFGDALGDVDLCLRLRKRGLHVLWTPHAALRLQVPRERAGPQAADPKAEVTKRLRDKWPEVFAVGDPFYSAYLSRAGDFSFAPRD